MRYEWDEAKAIDNESKHGIDFADAATVFSDPGALTVEDREHDEQRLVTIAMDALQRLLVVVYTWRGEETIRIISARPVTRGERRQYEEEE